MKRSSDLLILRKMQSKPTNYTDIPSLTTRTRLVRRWLRMYTAQISFHENLLHGAQLGDSWKWLLVWESQSFIGIQ